MQEISVPMHCPSFSSYSSIKFAEIADRVTAEFSDVDRDEYGLHPKVHEQENNRKMETDDQIQSSNNHNDDDNDFEFAFVSTTDPASASSFSISADQIFSNGVIKPIFPIFNRDNIDICLNENKQETNYISKPAPPSRPPPIKSSSSKRLPLGRLFIEEQDSSSLSSSSSSSSSSSEAEDLESVRPGTYCIWSPKKSIWTSSPDNSTTTPFNKKKSYSRGNNNNIKAPAKRFRLMDLIRRSNSDVNETYVFLAPLLTSSSSSSKAKKSKDDKVEAISMDVQKKMISGDTNKTAAAAANGVKTKKRITKKFNGGESSSSSVSSHEIHYLRNRALKEGDRRRSYLPYKRDLIGFFTNVNGLNRNLYPFQAA